MRFRKHTSLVVVAWTLVTAAGLNRSLAQKVYWAQSFSDRIQRANVDGSAAQILVEAPVAFDPVAIKVDAVNNKLYWAETFDDTIRRANLDGSSMQTVLQPPAVFDPVAIDLDELASPGKIYWVRGVDDTILRANLDGTGVETLVGPPNSFDVVAIALDPGRNAIYWAENPGNRIRRANLDGSNVGTFLDVIFVSDPVALAVDEVCGHVYWAERSGNRIRRASADGLTVETVLDAIAVSDPVALAFIPGSPACAGTLYWAEGSTDRIQRASNSGGIATTIVEPPILFDPVALDVDPRALSTVPVIAWDPSPLAPTRASRTLTMTLHAATATGGVGTAALQIKMIDLQHPSPRNRTTNPPPNFTAFDTRLNGVCSGASTGPNYNGHHCDNIAECLGADANPLISTDDGVCGSLLGCAGADGCVRWVGPVSTFREKQGVPGLGVYKAARLQCTPYYTDWTTLGRFTVFGAEIIPSSTYDATSFGVSCKGVEPGCTDVSPSVAMSTRRSGDVVSPWNPPDPGDQPTGGDVGAVLDKFKGTVGSPSNIAALIYGNLPDPNVDIGGQEIGETVNGFKGLAYSFSGPCTCPSAVTCGATACTSENSAPCGAGLCVITCVGGINDGLPCRDFPPNLPADHCPGGACPTTGSCRDRCGRCGP